MNIKGYKVFNNDWTCRGFRYKVGETFEHNGDIALCNKGFHFCQKASDCFNYYPFNPNNKVAEVLAIGLCETGNNKTVTNKIVIVREIEWQELLTMVNTGKNCTGLSNTGDCNTGDCNTGNSNTGDWNTGDWNTGNRNTGDCNTGNKNTGDCNTGDWNTGDWNTGDWNTGDWNTGNRNTGNRNTGNRNTGNSNTGDWNTGDWNTGNRNTGFFSTITPQVTLFEKETDLTYSQARELKGIQILSLNYKNNWWVYEENMSEEEKEQNPTYKTTGGYLKTIPFKDACKLMWERLTEEEKLEVKNIPNFDKRIFKEITGIEV